MVVILTGLMGAGKTTLLRQLFGKFLPKKKYTSTGIAEEPWRGIVDMKGLKLLENHEDIFDLVAKFISIPSMDDNGRDSGKKDHREMSKEVDQSAGETTEDHNSMLDNTEGSTGAVHYYGNMESADHVGASKEPANKTVYEIAEIIQQNPKKYEGKLEIVYMIDTGGQPECLEVMPTLIHNANLILLVVDLSKSLDIYALPTYHNEGNPFEKKCLLTTNRELIEQLGQTIIATETTQVEQKTESGTKKQGVKIVIIASHKDEVKGGNPIDKLKSFAKDNFSHVSLYDQCVFDVNLRDSNDINLPKIHEIIEKEMKKMKEINVPLSFVLFEREAMVYLQELEREVEVLTLEECYEVGRRIHIMKKKVVEGALKYLHKNNIYLYFETIGPGLVFLDPKALLDSVNTVIFNSYSGNINTLMLAEKESLSKGIITEELLEKMSKFVPGVFEACHAIKVFEKLYILAKKSECEYMMMCLLPRLSKERFESRKLLFTRFGPVQPLRLDFGIGERPDWRQCCSPSGSFGSTIACLLSSEFKWRILCTDSVKEEPVCLYHDIAVLCPKDLSLEVTLVNNNKYFEVYVDVDSENADEYKKLPQVRRNIKDAVRKVLRTMKVSLNVAEGFKCDCGSTKYLNETKEEEYYARCKKGHKDKLKDKCILQPKLYWIEPQAGM